MDGVEEDHLLLSALHPAARLHADRQLDHRLDRAEAKLVVGLFAQHRRADLKHGTKLPEEEKVGKLLISLNKGSGNQKTWQAEPTSKSPWRQREDQLSSSGQDATWRCFGKAPKYHSCQLMP